MSNTIPVDEEFRQVQQTPLTTRSRSVLSKLEANQAVRSTSNIHSIKAGLEDPENPADNQPVNQTTNLGKRKIDVVTSTVKRAKSITQPSENTNQQTEHAKQQSNKQPVEQPKQSVEQPVKPASPEAAQSTETNQVQQQPGGLSPATASMWCNEELPVELIRPASQLSNRSLTDSSLAVLQRDFNELLHKSYQLHQNAIDDEVWRDQSINQLEALQMSHETFREENRVLREENYSLKLTNDQLTSENKKLRTTSQSANQSNNQSVQPPSISLAIQVEDDGGRIALLDGQANHQLLNHIDAESIPVSVYHAHIDRINEQHRAFGDEQKQRFEALHTMYQTNQSISEQLIDQMTRQVDQLKRSLSEKEELIARMQTQSPTSPFTPKIGNNNDE